MPGVDYVAASQQLRIALDTAQDRLLAGDVLQTAPSITRHLDTLFASATQAYREGLVGCVLARWCDRTIDVTKPYMKHGEHAYNGRTLDERVVNPILQERRIPVSRAPFLSTLRRGVRFDESMRGGVRDTHAFDAFLAVVRYINRVEEQADLEAVLLVFCARFIDLRERSQIQLSRLQHISHEQYAMLLDGLLAAPSGGRFPVFLTEAMFHAVRQAFNLDWEITVQGINVADSPSKVSGDLEIRSGDHTILAAEITERVVDKQRVQATFQTKIAVANINDYLFLVTQAPEDDAVVQARQYFSRGHEVNFVDIRGYILATLLSVGAAGRTHFNRVLMERIDQPDVPVALKVAWNEQIAQITAV